MGLLDALQRLVGTSPDTRKAAIADLAQLKDERVIAALAHSLRYDGDSSVRRAAARALGAYSYDASSHALMENIGNTAEDAPLRIAAVGALAKHEGELPFTLLWDARDDEDEDVAQAIKTGLRTHFPKRYQEKLLETPVLDQQGRWYLVPAMAFHGGLFMTALASVAGGEPGPASVLGGATVGGLTPYLLTIDKNMPRSEALWLDSTITWGLFGGLSTYAMVGDINDENGVLWSAIGGQTLGLTAGLLTHKDIPYSWGDIVYMNASGIAGTMITGSGIAMANNDDPKAVSATLAGGFTAGAMGSALLTRELEFTTGDAAAIAGLTGYGYFFSAGIPTLIGGESNGDSNLVEGAMLLGGGLSFVGASVLTQYYEPTTTQVTKASVGALWGLSVGAGLGMMAAEDPMSRTAVALPMAGSLGGLLAASVATDDTEFKRGDFYAVGLGMAWGTWQGDSAGRLIFDERDPDTQQAEDRARTGSLLLGFGLGGFAGAGVGRYFDPTPMDVAMAGSVGVWGGWLTGWSAYAAQKHEVDISDDQVSTAVLVGSDVGLVTGAVLLSSLVEMPAKRLGWINAAGLLGMGLGSSFTAIFSDNVAEGNVVGTAAGLITGTLFTANMDFPREKSTAGLYPKRPSPWDSLVWWPTAGMVPDEEGRAHLQVGVAGFY